MSSSSATWLDFPPSPGSSRPRATSSPAVVYQPTLDRIVAFVVGANGRLYDKYYNNGWIWESQGLPSGAAALNAPAVVYQKSLDRIVVFVVGANGHLYDKYYNNGWIWEDQGLPPGTLAVNAPVISATVCG